MVGLQVADVLPTPDEMVGAVRETGLVTVYDLPREARGSLDFLAPCIDDVEHLDVLTPKCRDVSILGRATRLTGLDLEEPRLRKGADLSSAPGLEDLSVRGGHPGSLELLSSSNAHHVTITGASQDDLDAVRVDRVQELVIAGSRVPLVMPVGPWALLEVLDLYRCQAIDLGALECLAEWRTVQLTKVKHVAGLAVVKRTHHLLIEDCGSFDDWRDIARTEVRNGSLIGRYSFRDTFLDEMTAEQRLCWFGNGFR